MANKNVTVLVFKCNLYAFFGLSAASIITLIIFFWLFFLVPQYGWLSLSVIIFLAYIKYAKNSHYKTSINDDNKLTLSNDGIQYGEKKYPAGEIEAVAIYLFAFENFDHREDSVLKGGTTPLYVIRPVARINYHYFVGVM